MNLPPLRKIARSESFRAAAILFGILNICFLPCIWGNKTLLESAQASSSVMPTGAWAGPPVAMKFGKTLDSGAGGFFAEANLPLLRYQYFHEKVAPLWNPYQGYGRPLAANQQSQPFYPLTLALLLHITPKTYNWFILSRLFLAGIASYFFLRFFVSFWPGVAGGVTSMLAGYYLLFLTLPQLSAEVLLPASLLAAEYLLRKRNYWSIVAFAIVLLLVLLGGMPESALLLFTLLYSYILFRIASDAGLRSSYLCAIARLTAATCAGLALAAFFLLPFWELMGRSFDLHQLHNTGGLLTGLAHFPSPGLSIFTYFFPLLYGRPFSGVFSSDEFGLRNYVGLIATFLLMVALIAAVRNRRRDDSPLRAITWFFACFTALLILKSYGFPGVNAIGALPFFNMVNFLKYNEALLSICVSILAAIGLERLLRRDISVRAQVIALAATALLIPIALWYSRATIRHEIAQLHVPRAFPILAIAVPTVLLVGVAVALIFARKRLAVVLVALLTAEMWMIFLAPAYYWFNRLPRQTRNPYLGAPYIDLLKKEAGYDRIFARDSLLFPNWSAAFRLYDIRDLDALYEPKYLVFARNFFEDQAHRFENDLGDRFNGMGAYELTTPLAERLLQLSSVKYIASIKPFVIPNRMIDEILEQNRGRLIPGKEEAIAQRHFVLSGEARNALGEHPPYERMPYRIHVGNRPKEIFDFSYGLDSFVFDKTGDGAEFIIELKEPSGRITKQFSRYIDPKHNAQERRWLDGQLDLSAWRNQTIELLFSTALGPKGDTAWDWAAWSNFHFEGHTTPDQPPPFRLIYNDEAKIYRYDNVLPRAAIYHRAEFVPSGGGALAKLADPSLDIFESVVLNASALSAEQRAQVAAINREAPARRVEAASIRSYQSQDVEIEASLDRSGILVLNDTAAPGWTATVDGHPAEWFDANYLFRGLLLPAGKHAIRFRYQPKSFRAGAAISGLTMAALLAIGLVIPKARQHG
ncbi:MAG TPA: YfhO family protein [Bryobacteraceae bacterium]|nr:YfhO family protein [Bryobacteraceae bacterium]